MKGVKFDNKHSYNDFSLILSSKKIGVPQPKIETVEVPGADAPLDFTEFFGDVKFDNRTLEFEFSLLLPVSEIPWTFSQVQNAINGRKMKITLDEDQGYYYYGRVTVKECTIDKTIGKITVSCDCEPYKYKQIKTVREASVTTMETVTLSNLRQHVVPTFTTDAEIGIEFEGNKYTVSTEGVFTIPEIVLKEGDNVLKITGTANVKIEYQEGGL